jgi:hypothetical protein
MLNSPKHCFKAYADCAAVSVFIQVDVHNKLAVVLAPRYCMLQCLIHLNVILGLFNEQLMFYKESKFSVGET